MCHRCNVYRNIFSVIYKQRGKHLDCIYDELKENMTNLMWTLLVCLKLQKETMGKSDLAYMWYVREYFSLYGWFVYVEYDSLTVYIGVLWLLFYPWLHTGTSSIPIVDSSWAAPIAYGWIIVGIYLELLGRVTEFLYAILNVCAYRRLQSSKLCVSAMIIKQAFKQMSACSFSIVLIESRWTTHNKSSSVVSQY